MINVTPESISVELPKNAAERLESRQDAARRFSELDRETRDITYDGSDADTLERLMGSLLSHIDESQLTKNESEG